MFGICRDCFVLLNKNVTRCKECKSPRLIFNSDIEGLTIAHLDCDAFYASIEKRENPELKNLPVIVGGGPNGVVTTCCYIARISGVRSAMPMFKAKLLCPQAIVIKPRMKLYKKVSLEIKEILYSVTPLVQFVSIDEAFIDLKGTRRLHKKFPAALLAQIAKQIEENLGITVSIGLSFNKFFAKIGSDLEKPRGLSIVGISDARNILQTKKISILRGVGKKNLEKLRNNGITFIRDLKKYDKRELENNYGALGRRLWYFSRGYDDSRVEPKQIPKSISKEITFDTCSSDTNYIRFRLWEMCEVVSVRLKESDLRTKHLTLKIKPNKSNALTLAVNLETPTNLAELLYQASILLLKKFNTDTEVKLVGISLKSLSKRDDNKTNFNLFDKETSQLNSESAEKAMDSIRKKFGKGSIFKGRSLNHFSGGKT